MDVTKAQREEIVKGFTKEELKEFKTLEVKDQDALIVEIFAISNDATDLGGRVELANAIIEENDCRMHIAGSLLVKKGRELVAQYLGLQFIFSKEAKENWDSVVAQDGETKMFRTRIHRFRRTDGTNFGIFATPMMNNAFRTLLTATSGGLVAADPVVKMIYQGKITKEVAAKEYNFKMSIGTETHGWLIDVEKTARREDGKGAQNLLNAPLPLGSSKDDMTSDEVNMENFKNLQERQESSLLEAH